MPENDGPNAHPVYGQRPPAAYGFTVNPQVFRYRGILDEVRNHPRHWAQIGVFEKGSPPVTRKKVERARNEIYHWLAKNCPTEAWQVSMRTDTNSWSRRELWARYSGVLTQEEADILRLARYQAIAFTNEQGRERPRLVVARLLEMADPEKQAPHPWIR
jgi:hypothetical protein